MTAKSSRKARNRTRVVVSDLGGIPSNSGLVAAGGAAIAPLVNFAKNELASVDVATGKETRHAVPWTVNYPVFVIGHH